MPSLLAEIRDSGAIADTDDLDARINRFRRTVRDRRREPPGTEPEAESSRERSPDQPWSTADTTLPEEDITRAED